MCVACMETMATELSSSHTLSSVTGQVIKSGARKLVAIHRQRGARRGQVQPRRPTAIISQQPSVFDAAVPYDPGSLEPPRRLTSCSSTSAFGTYIRLKLVRWWDGRFEDVSHTLASEPRCVPV